MQSLDPQTLALGVIWYIVFLFSTTCHESAHALVAKLGGDLTAFHSGQVTLNPIPHIRREPFGTVLAPLASYLFFGWMVGWASAPYDPIWQRRYPRRAAWMALAGPAANFALMIAAAVAIRVGVAVGHFRAPGVIKSLTEVTQSAQGVPNFEATLLSILFALNLLLGTFNLLPVPPLDGNTGVTLLMSERRALRFLDWSQNAGFAPIGLLLAWVLFGKIFDKIFTLALNLLYPGAHYG